MDKCIIFTDPEHGGLSIMWPAPDARMQVLAESAVWGVREMRRITGTTIPAGPYRRPGFGAERRVMFTPGEIIDKVKVLIKPAVYRPETDEEFLARVIKETVPAGVEYHVLDRADVPADRTFRNAWRVENGSFGCCMDTARRIHRARIREERAPLLSALDVEYQRADEAGDADAKKAVAARKQALRDAPADPAIDAAATPEELAKTWPLP